MASELDRTRFVRVEPLFARHLREPLLWAVLEGRREGRVWVDDAASPRAAFVWSGVECAYLAGEPAEGAWGGALRDVVLGEVLPAIEARGGSYLSLFAPSDEHARAAGALFAGQLPHVTPLETYRFVRRRFRTRRVPLALPAGLELAPVGRAVLQAPENSALADEVSHYWGNVDAFLAASCGWCVLDGDVVVSYCFSEALGGGARALSAWTARAYRRQGLAAATCSRMVERCLRERVEPFWMCDAGNAASRRLAGRLGFVFRGEVPLVDVPVEPFSFYCGLAAAFFVPNGLYQRAAEAYERAFLVGDGDATAHYRAAVAWALAGDGERALSRLDGAVARGWQDRSALEAEQAFRSLHDTPAWAALIGSCSGTD